VFKELIPTAMAVPSSLRGEHPYRNREREDRMGFAEGKGKNT